MQSTFSKIFAFSRGGSALSRPSCLALFAACLLLLGSASSTFASVEDDVRFIRNYVQSIEGDTDGIFTTVQALQALIRLHSAGVSVTNFLGEESWDVLVEEIWQQFADGFTDGSGVVYVMPYSESYMDMGYYLSGMGGPNWFDGDPIGKIAQYQSLYTRQILDLLRETVSGSSNLSISVSSSAVSAISNAVSLGMSVSGSEVEQPPDVEDQLDQYRLENTDSDPVTNITSNLPQWSYSATPTLELSPLEQATLADGATGFTPPDSGIPILSGAITSPWIDLPSWTLEPSETGPWRVYFVGWKRRIGSITTAFWSVIAFFAVAYVVRREWNFYASLGRTQSEEIAAHENEMDLF